MILSFDTSGTGLGGPGMWDPMPLTPPSSPPAQANDPEFVWSRPAQLAPDETKEAAALKKRPAARKPAKKTAKKKAAKKKTTKKKPVRKKKTVKKKPAKKKAVKKKKTAGRAKKRR